MPKGPRLPKVVRVTAALDPEVAKQFQRLADFSGVSLARTIGSWCGQTVDGVAVVLDMMTKAHNAPKTVMAQFHGRATSMQNDIDQAIAVGEEERAARPAPPAATAPARSPAKGNVQALRASSPRPVIRGDRVTYSSDGGHSKGKT